ncbi:MAG TPA: Hcp family type VI secretion system effector [Pseudomonadota bacterium]|nr:Hcp family type VI secretion system effector [Pseudomonadota bacterium]
MALQAHMSIEGTEQGPIEGDCMLKGRHGTIEVQEFGHEVYMPHDGNTGTPTGNPIHKPLTICKTFDKTSPKLQKALTRGERLKTVEIKWYRIKPDGKQEHYYTHLLQDAILVSIKPYMRNRLDRDSEEYQHMEEVSFTYRKITWTWEPAGVGAEADWREPAA